MGEEQGTHSKVGNQHGEVPDRVEGRKRPQVTPSIIEESPQPHKDAEEQYCNAVREEKLPPMFSSAPSKGWHGNADLSELRDVNIIVVCPEIGRAHV